jgi:hypothetical protein
VECYSGYRGAEEPRAFFLGSRRIEIMVIVDRWIDPEYRYFKVQAYDGTRYILRYDELSETWEMKWFTVSG